MSDGFESGTPRIGHYSAACECGWTFRAGVEQLAEDQAEHHGEKRHNGDAEVTVARRMEACR